jgi:hypothetical protein
MTYSEYEYEIGQEIYHAVYGYGIILSKTDIGQGVYRYEVGFQRYPGQIIDVIGNVQIMPIEEKDQDESDAKSLRHIIDILSGSSKKKKDSKEKDDSMAMNERKLSLGDNGNVAGGAVFNSSMPAHPVIKKSEPENVARHRKIVMGLNELYAKKNADYGDSFHETFLEEGMAMARIRLSDKLNRFKSLTRGNSQQVNDESIRDTLLDLANYAIMTVIELDRKDY